MSMPHAQQLLEKAQAGETLSTKDRRHVVVECYICKKQYTRWRSAHNRSVKSGAREVCSPKCKGVLYSSNPVEVECFFCKTIFLRKQNAYNEKCRNSTKQYCSRECATASTSTVKQYSCFYCKKDIFKSDANAAKNKSGRHFCSQQCFHKAFGPLNKGKNHIAYTTGSGTYRKVGLLQGSTCVSCGESRLYLLVVHHIDGDRKNNVSENLEVVCQNCHAIRHMKLKNGVWLNSFKALTPRQLIETFYGDATCTIAT